MNIFNIQHWFPILVRFLVEEINILFENENPPFSNLHVFKWIRQKNYHISPQKSSFVTLNMHDLKEKYTWQVRESWMNWFWKFVLIKNPSIVFCNIENCCKNFLNGRISRSVSDCLNFIIFIFPFSLTGWIGRRWRWC